MEEEVVETDSSIPLIHSKKSLENQKFEYSDISEASTMTTNESYEEKLNENNDGIMCEELIIDSDCKEGINKVDVRIVKYKLMECSKCKESFYHLNDFNLHWEEHEMS